MIPGLLLLAAYGLEALLLPLVRTRQQWPAWGLAVVAGCTLLALQWSTLFVLENRGLPVQLNAVDSLLRDAPLVLVRDLDPIATALFVGYGRPILPLRDSATPVDAQTRALWDRCTTAAPCALLHADYAGLSRLALGATRRVTLTRVLIAQTVTPLPRTMERETTDILITPVLGLARDPAMALAGAYRDWHFDDAGLYREEIGHAWSSRWTNGAADLALPAVPADTLEVILGAIERGPNTIRLVLDGQVLFAGPLAPGLQRLAFALPPITPATKTRRLEIASPTFVPKLQQRGLDVRRLGVSLLAVRQIDSSAPRLAAGASADAYRADVAVIGTPFTPPLAVRADAPPRVTLALANASNAVWPARGDTRSGEAPVAVGILWLRAGESVPLFEQRIELPFSLHPGERLLLAPELAPRRPDGSVLPAGPYDVALGLVHEGVAWFAAKGGALPRLPVTIAATVPKP